MSRPVLWSAFALACAWAPPVAAAPRRAVPAPASDVKELGRAYLDGLFAARPHLASFMGDHRFDAKVMDLGEEALDGRTRALRAFLARLDEAERKPERRAPSLDETVNLGILRDGARLELLYLEEIRDHAWDPRLYDSFPYYDPREIVAARLSDIIHGDFAIETVRRQSVLGQLQSLPRYLKQVEAWLMKPYRGGTVPPGWRRPPKVFVEQAIAGNKGRIEFFRSEVQPFIGTDARARQVYEAALAALVAYQAMLDKELLPRADGDWRLGKALYDKKFPLALQTTRTPDEMIRRAEADFRKTRAELGRVARRLHGTLWPGQPVAGEDAVVIGRVKDELGKVHPKPAELVAAHARRLDALRAFIDQERLVALPPRDTLSVEPMPPYKRGATAAEYLAPGVLEQRPSFHATYYVDPIDPTWSPERVESYLRGHTDYEIELTAAHEAYPGHHTQMSVSRTSLDPVRAVLWNGPMVEGWAVYGTSRLVARGWGGKDNDRYRFFDLRGRMVSASNLLLDVRLQRGELSEADALRFMVEQGFQERATAERKLLRAKLDSTQLCQYFLGLDEIEELRAEVEKSGAFDEAGFHERLIGHGSIALKFLRQYLLKR